MLTVCREAEAISTSSYSVNKRLKQIIYSRLVMICPQGCITIATVTSEEQLNPAIVFTLDPCGTHLDCPSGRAGTH